MGPINYITQLQNPLQSFASGLEFGAGLQNIQAQREAAQIKMLQQQQAMEQQHALSQAITDLRTKANPTFADYERVAMLAPKGQAEAILKSWEQRSKESQQNELRSIGQVVAALKSNPSVGINLLRERAIAAENAGDKAQTQAFDTWAKIAELNPKEAVNLISIGAAHLPGAKDMFDALAKAQPTEAQGYEVVSPEKAKAMGLPSGVTYQRNTTTNKLETLGAAGGERFEIIPPSQASALGLPKGTYQRDATSGKITAIGTGGVTVNMPPQVGSIPPDYKMIYDAQNRPVSMEVIPGSKTALQLAEKEQKGAQVAESTITSSGIVLDEVKGLRSLIKNQKTADPVTGTLGAVVGEKGGVLAAGSARKTAEARIQTIKANIGFDRLNQMRSESPTGGALGNITEQELAFLQSVLGSIDLSQKDEAILANLKRLEKIYNGIIRKAQAYPNAAKYGFGKAAAPTQPAPAAPAAPASTTPVAPTPATPGMPAGFKLLPG